MLGTVEVVSLAAPFPLLSRFAPMRALLRSSLGLLLLVAFLAVALARPAYAQITLTANDLSSRFGQTLTSSIFNATDLTGVQTLADRTGADQTWDFSTLPYEDGGTGTAEYVSPPAGLPGADDPAVAGANYAIASQYTVPGGTADSTVWFYGRLDADAHYDYGVFFTNPQTGQLDSAIYDEPFLAHPTPMTFGATWTDETTRTDDFSGTPISFTVTRAGDVNGYGTLVTPAGSEACLRYEYQLDLTTFGFTVTTYIISFVTKSGMTAAITLDASRMPLSASYTVLGDAGGGSETAPTEAPALASPADGAEGVSPDAALTWAAVDGATGYDVQLATDDAFTALVLDQAGLATTEASASNLAAGTVHHWRVRATNGAGAGPWSAARTFTTVPSAPAAVALTTPADGALDLGTTLTLSWEAAARAATYDVQLATDAAFTALVAGETGLADTSLEIDGLTGGTSYHWRVRAVNAGGAGPWSAAQFTTASGVAIERDEAGVPRRYALEAAYPNPFNPQTTLAFALPESTPVTLTIYDAQGRLVETLVQGTLAAGRYRYAWSADGQPSGLYLYRLATPAFTRHGTMLLVK